MNPGRNAPCPCGSGKKFKKCCMNASPHKTTASLTPVEISRRSAYIGRVGRQRRTWCEAFIAWKTEQLEKISAEQESIAKSTKSPISCSRGCWFCCSQHVGASLQECEAIVYWLSQHPEVRDAFLGRYSNWRQRVREHESVFTQVNQAGSISMSQLFNNDARHEFMQKAEAYGQLNIPCPFLDNGSCSIYPVRPFVCASVVALSPPENCNPSSESAPVLQCGTLSPDLQPPYFRGPKDFVMFSPVVLLVYEILHGGFIYLNDLPGMNGLEEEAFSDPEVRAVFGAGS